MGVSLKGTVHGSTVTLDTPAPSLEGRRVLVVLEPAEEPVLAKDVNEAAWNEWVQRGPEGPLDTGAPGPTWPC